MKKRKLANGMEVICALYLAALRSVERRFYVKKVERMHIYCYDTGVKANS